MIEELVLVGFGFCLAYLPRLAEAIYDAYFQMEPWMEVITTVGFPIALCLWFMFRLEIVIKNNTKALIRVEKALEHK